jgi:hypothetical protein
LCPIVLQSVENRVHLLIVEQRGAYWQDRRFDFAFAEPDHWPIGGIIGLLRLSRTTAE